MDAERGEKVHASENRGVFSPLWKVLSILALVAVLCAAVAYVVNAAGGYKSSLTSEDFFGGILEDEDNFKYDPERVIKRSAPQNCNSSSSDGKEPSAHIVGIKPTFYSGSNPHQNTGCSFTTGVQSLYPTFTNSSYLSHVRGMEFFARRSITALKITMCGLYHIYSQVTWQYDNNNNNNNNNGGISGTLEHSTNLYTENRCRDDRSHFVQRQSSIMISTKMLPSEEGKSVTSQQSGTFLLCSGDIVYVKIATNTRNCISTDGKQTFFGAYMVGRCSATGNK